MNATELGLPSEAHVFEGRYIEIMPQLIQAGLTPWNIADVMDHRNNSVGTSHQEQVWNTYVNSDVGIARNKEKIYVEPHSARLRAVNTQTHLRNGGLALATTDLPATVKTYNRKDLILDRLLQEKEARAHPLWLDFANGDQQRLDRLVENTFRLGKDKYNCDTLMGIYVPKEDKPTLRAVMLHTLGYESQANGESHLDDYDIFSSAHLVGVRA